MQSMQTLRPYASANLGDTRLPIAGRQRSHSDPLAGPSGVASNATPGPTASRPTGMSNVFLRNSSMRICSLMGGNRFVYYVSVEMPTSCSGKGNNLGKPCASLVCCSLLSSTVNVCYGSRGYSRLQKVPHLLVYVLCLPFERPGTFNP
jgi:hypothetical protein